MGKVNNFIPPIREYAMTQGTPSGVTPTGSPVKPGLQADEFKGPGLFTLEEKPGTPSGGTPANSADLKILATDANYKLIAGNDGAGDSISKVDVAKQLAQDTMTIAHPELLQTNPGQYIQASSRLRGLSYLYSNFDNIAKNGVVDLQTLQAAAAANTSAAPLTSDQKDKIQPLVDNNGGPSSTFTDIAKAGPNSQGTSSKDPTGTSIDSGDLDAAIANGSKPGASAADQAAGKTAQDIKNDPQLMGALTNSPGTGGVFAEGVGFTIADVKRLLGTT